MEGYLVRQRMISRLGSIGLSVGLVALMGGIAMAQRGAINGIRTVIPFKFCPQTPCVLIMSLGPLRRLATRVSSMKTLWFCRSSEATFVLFDNGGRTAQDFSALGGIFCDGHNGGFGHRMDADLTKDRYVFTGDDTQILTEDGRIFSENLFRLISARAW